MNLDIVKLARVLGYDVPIGEERDEVLVGDSGQACRRPGHRLGGRAVARLPEDASQQSNASPPAFGEPLAAPRARAWLPDSVSYTQLSEFERCPRQFRIRRVLGITPPAAVASGRLRAKTAGNRLARCVAARHVGWSATRRNANAGLGALLRARRRGGRSGSRNRRRATASPTLPDARPMPTS